MSKTHQSGIVSGKQVTLSSMFTDNQHLFLPKMAQTKDKATLSPASPVGLLRMWALQQYIYALMYGDAWNDTDGWIDIGFEIPIRIEGQNDGALAFSSKSQGRLIIKDHQNENGSHCQIADRKETAL